MPDTVTVDLFRNVGHLELDRTVAKATRSRAGPPARRAPFELDGAPGDGLALWIENTHSEDLEGIPRNKLELDLFVTPGGPASRGLEVAVFATHGSREDVGA